MKIVEERHPKETWLMWKLGNLLAVDQDSVRSIGIAWGFKENGEWNWVPRVTGNVSLFYNAIAFARYSTWPPLLAAQVAAAGVIWHYFGSLHCLWPLLLGVFWSFRWSGSTTEKAYIQAGIGIKLNGRFSITLRRQSDPASAVGVTGPNFGQAVGFEYGTK